MLEKDLPAREPHVKKLKRLERSTSMEREKDDEVFLKSDLFDAVRTYRADQNRTKRQMFEVAGSPTCVLTPYS